MGMGMTFHFTLCYKN